MTDAGPVSWSTGLLGAPWPPWLVRFALVVSLVASATPMVLAVARRDALDGSEALMVTTGGLVSAQLLFYSLTVRRLTRLLRSRERVRTVGLRTAVSFGLAASPLGGWVADRWLGVGVLTGATGAVVLSGTLLGVRAAGAISARRELRGLGAWRRLARVANILSRFGLLPFFLVCVAHPDRELVVAAFGLVVTEGLTLVVTSLVRFPYAAALMEARFVAALPPDLRAVRFEDWLEDAFLAHPGRPDYSLVHGLCSGVMINLGQPQVPPSSAPEHLVAVADEALCLVEARAVPLYPAEHLEVLRRRHARARAHWATNRGNLLKFQTRYEQALESWRDAVRLDPAVPAPNHEAMIRVSIAALLTVELGHPEAAAAELDPVLGNDRLHPFVRRMALVILATAARLRDDTATFDLLLARLGQLPIRQRHVAATVREVDMPYGRWQPRDAVQALRTELERTERRMLLTYRDEDDVEDGDAEVLVERSMIESAAGRLAMSAHSLWLAGDPHEAELLLTRAVEVATAADDRIWVFRAHRDLGGIKLLDHGQPLEAYEHLEQAIAALEGVRANVLDPDLRAGVVGQAGEAYVLAVVALVALVRRGERPPQLAGTPAQLAFQVAERMRSRVLLELLGGTATTTPSGPEDGLLHLGEPSSYDEIRALLSG